MFVFNIKKSCTRRLTLHITSFEQHIFKEAPQKLTRDIVSLSKLFIIQPQLICYLRGLIVLEQYEHACAAYEVQHSYTDEKQ